MTVRSVFQFVTMALLELGSKSHPEKLKPRALALLWALGGADSTALLIGAGGSGASPVCRASHLEVI